MARVYVYGTLKRGGCRNEAMDGATFEKTVVLRGFAMYDLGSYPAVIPESGGEVVVEQWDVPRETIDILDQIEGVGAGLFKRTVVRIDDDEGGWIYEAADTDMIAGRRRIVWWPTYADVANVSTRI